MKRHAKLLAVLLSVAVAGHAIAQTAAAELVCRFTGKVMAGCPSPDGALEGAQFERAGCCEVRKAETGPVPPAVFSASRCVESGPPLLALPPVHCHAVAKAELRRPESPATSPPPLDRLFVRHRQLLI